MYTKRKEVFLQSRFARHLNGASEARKARRGEERRGEERSERNGHSSLNEWNDVANNSSNFFESLAKTRYEVGTDKKRKKLIRMESLILAQDERWRQA